MSERDERWGRPWQTILSSQGSCIFTQVVLDLVVITWRMHATNSESEGFN